MYLTAGQYKGTKIEVPKTAKPTLSKVRESIFNMLIQFDTKENKFLDMFAGSAIMGLEAISRGYQVKEIEINPKSAKIIKQNYDKINVEPDLTICDAMKFKGSKFNIVYIDPPWQYKYEPIIEKALELLEPQGLIIIEHDKALEIEKISQELNLKVIKSKKYGRVLVDILISN